MEATILQLGFGTAGTAAGSFAAASLSEFLAKPGSIPLLAGIIVCLPVASFALKFVFQIISNRLAKAITDKVAVALAGIAFLLSVPIVVYFVKSGDPDLVREWSFTWATLGNTPLRLGILIDSASALTLCFATACCFLIFYYSMGYMARDEKYARFFSYLSLFAAGMFGMVVSNNLLSTYCFWEIMGLCSYLLIGFYHEKPSAANASLKAFIVTRVGDVGMFIGVMLAFAWTGSFEWGDLYASVQNYANAPEGTKALLSFMGFMLFMGPIGKSAQFPLHVWLPDAMEGPTPVSAMIHAATMVSAGVFLTFRFAPMFTPTVLVIVALIGSFTALFAAVIALTQFDIKKILAYSTISQLGFMIAAIGMGSGQAGVWHMTMHGFYKAGLFLCAGIVIHCVGTNDIREMGGLRKKLPVTFYSMLFAGMSLAGFPFFAGFFSKDAILATAIKYVAKPHEWILNFRWFGGEAKAANLSNFGLHWLPLIFLVVAAFLTAIYIFRLLIAVFFGESRYKEEPHREHHLMYFPVAVLAVLAVFAGYFGYTALVRNPAPLVMPDEIVAAAHEENAAESGTAHAAEETHGGHDSSHLIAVIVSLIVGLGGIALAFAMYMFGVIDPAKFIALPVVGAIHGWAVDLFGIDRLYHEIFVEPYMKLADLLRLFDEFVIDGLVNLCGYVFRGCVWVAGIVDQKGVDGIVNLTADVTKSFGEGASEAQTGKIQHYLIGALALIVFPFIIFLFWFFIKMLVANGGG